MAGSGQMVLGEVGDWRGWGWGAKSRGGLGTGNRIRSPEGSVQCLPHTLGCTWVGGSGVSEMCLAVSMKVQSINPEKVRGKLNMLS